MAGRLIRTVILVLMSAGLAAAANVELKLSTPLEATLKDNFCLHVSPDGESDIIICLNAGAPLTLVARMKDKGTLEGEEGHWYRAEVMGGAEGWVFSTYLDIKPVGEGDATVAGSDCE
ncbi:MAG TPA: SH3 domain-containing protein [bacterium]|nr:SH3 domain-containing protein [bacterium]